MFKSEKMRRITQGLLNTKLSQQLVHIQIKIKYQLRVKYWKKEME